MYTGEEPYLLWLHNTSGPKVEITVIDTKTNLQASYSTSFTGESVRLVNDKIREAIPNLRSTVIDKLNTLVKFNFRNG